MPFTGTTPKTTMDEAKAKARTVIRLLDEAIEDELKAVKFYELIAPSMLSGYDRKTIEDIKDEEGDHVVLLRGIRDDLERFAEGKPPLRPGARD